MDTPGRLPDPDFWRGRRVLLTGHTGFKGAWLAAWLAVLGAEVTGLSLPPEPGSLAARLPPSALRDRHGDLRDPGTAVAALRGSGASVVIHLAAQSLVRRGFADPVGTFSSNVMGTVHLLEALRGQAGLRAAVLATSDKCYEPGRPGPFREGDRLGGHDPYGTSKAAAELAVEAWRRSFPDLPPVATVRAGNVLGGGDAAADRLLPDCLRAFAAGRPVRLRHSGATRPWQHVLDPLCGYLLLAERLVEEGDAVAGPWNFGPAPGGALPVRTVVELAAEAWGAGAAWEVDEVPGPPETPHLAVDSGRARARLGWRPRVAPEEAVRSAVRWHRAEAAGFAPALLLGDALARYAAAPVPA